MREAIGLEADAHRRLLAGDRDGARVPLRAAAERYRASWEAAGPQAYGRLIGMLKAAILAEADPAGEDLAGAAVDAAAYVRRELGEPAPSPAAAYALALAALVQGDDELAVRAAGAMPEGGEAFARAGAALTAIARRDAAAYADALRAVVADFEARPAHLTGVPIADTALMLEGLAAPRGLHARVRSPLLPV
jgi:hypothetical protein